MMLFSSRVAICALVRAKTIARGFCRRNIFSCLASSEKACGYLRVGMLGPHQNEHQVGAARGLRHFLVAGALHIDDHERDLLFQAIERVSLVLVFRGAW